MTYATPKDWTDPADGETYSAQVVLQLLVKPGSYGVGQNTLREPVNDPVVPESEVECYQKTSAIAGTQLVGLLVKLEKKARGRTVPKSSCICTQCTRGVSELGRLSVLPRGGAAYGKIEVTPGVGCAVCS